MADVSAPCVRAPPDALVARSVHDVHPLDPQAGAAMTNPPTVTLYDLAKRFIGTKEVSGIASNPSVLAWLTLDQKWPTDDSTPWCSAFVNYIAWLLGIKDRSKSLAARSWLLCGRPVMLFEAQQGDVVVLKRGSGPQPGPGVIDAPGHVGFYDSHDATRVHILGGNQGDSVSIAAFPSSDILSIRRLA